ncbi:MAG TPA: histidine kinase N-terminal domain-containing protein [Actinomycetaceae bacterium]|nr:histidine kinase N-terminal domain-containing protein [Actinomycetaceae bacterium]
MANLGEMLRAHGSLSPIEAEWLHLLVVDWQVVADLSFSDLVLWLDNGDGGFIGVAHCRPSTGVTVHQDDVVGQRLPQGRVEPMRRALTEGMIQHSTEPRWTGSYAVREDLVPVVCNGRAIAVMAREANLGIARSPSRLEVNYLALADDLCGMISRGEFPQTSAPAARLGGPRVGDGVLRLDADGVVLYASPNGMSCFHRLGLPDQLAGKVLASVVSSEIDMRTVVDETLPVVLMGRAAWQAEVESHGVALSLRSIPLTEYGKRHGAIIMVRDVSEIRLRERELMSKDATIREIHHRVKNNLQTVSALLRLQARRSENPEVKAALAEAQRRVATIAIVHENLSQTATETVDFDELLDRILSLTVDITHREHRVHTRVEGSVGMIPSSVATSLAVVITELVSNAVEHGLCYQPGTVTVTSARDGDELELHVMDDGEGMHGDGPGSGLGTQIVRTLVTAELRGTIRWSDAPGGGTDVILHAHM